MWMHESPLLWPQWERNKPSEERNKLVPVSREGFLKPLSHALTIVSVRHGQSSNRWRKTKNSKAKKWREIKNEEIEGGVVVTYKAKKKPSSSETDRGVTREKAKRPLHSQLQRCTLAPGSHWLKVDDKPPSPRPLKSKPWVQPLVDFQGTESLSPVIFSFTLCTCFRASFESFYNALPRDLSF